MPPRILLPTAIVILFCSSLQAGFIFLVPAPGYPTGAHANALAGPLLTSDYHPVDIPGAGSGVAFASKFGNVATHDYSVKLDFTTSPGFFDSSFAGLFSRTSVLGERASAESLFHFKVDSPAFFDVSGFIRVTDEIGTTIPGNVELEIELLEFPPIPGPPMPSTVFYSYQQSKSTMDEHLVVGSTGGDFANAAVGMPMGILDPSKTYRYRTLITLNAIDIDGIGPILPTDGSASLSGAHTFRVSPIAAVPEPSSFLTMAGLLLLWPVRRAFQSRIALACR